jgi:dTDP-4-amino-4,6-dideoxygalactose transaminase
LGAEVDAFEAEFARYCGAAYAVGVGSGTAALHLALLACGIGPGDEVITVPNSDLPSSMVISHCGARIVWVDVDPGALTMNPALVEAAITPRTRAIMPVHLHGHPADMDPILGIARRHGLLVIEDAALATGAEYKGRKTGGLGDVGCFSLAQGKILGAYGDAGIVVTNRREVAERIRVLRNYGFALEMDGALGGVLGFPNWRVVSEGFNERLDTLQAAIVRAKLPTLESRIARRRAAAAQYTRLLAGLDLTLPVEADFARHVYRAYLIMVADRDRVRERLAARGVATRVYYSPPLHLQPVYAHMGFGPGAFPASEWAGERMVGLPIFPEITDGQIELVVDAVRECVPEKS